MILSLWLPGRWRIGKYAYHRRLVQMYRSPHEWEDFPSTQQNSSHHYGPDVRCTRSAERRSRNLHEQMAMKGTISRWRRRSSSSDSLGRTYRRDQEVLPAIYPKWPHLSKKCAGAE